MRSLTLLIAAALLAPAALATHPAGDPPAGDRPSITLADPDTLTAAHGWLTELGLRLNLSQAAFANWQEGGLNTLAATSAVEGRFARVAGALRQRHDVRLGFGIVKQDTFSVRKATDVIRYAFDLQYVQSGAWRPSFATELRTQFTAGFDYDPSATKYPSLADRIVSGERLKVSDFFAPASWTQSLGVAYEPEGWFRARAGLGLKETIVLVERLRPVYGNQPDEAFRIQAGLDALLEARGEPFENVRVTSRMSLFQAFTQFAESAPDLLWENTIQLRFNRWLSVNTEVVALYDRDVSARVQLKEVLSIGLTMVLL
jgi:hypothetical protein